MYRLTPADLVRTAALGVTGRPARTVLSAFGIALGIASLVALTSVSASNQAQLLAELDALGADLAIIEPMRGPDGSPVELDDSAPAMIARHDGVSAVGTFEQSPPALGVFRNSHVPTTHSGGISVAVARPDVLDAVGAELAHGRWFDEANRGLPVTVLGETAARRLGVVSAGDRVFIAGQYFGVIGILADSGLASDAIDTAAIIGDRWVRQNLDFDGVGTIARVFVRAEPGRIDEVRSLLASAANPGRPHQIAVTRMSDLSAARDATDDAMTTLGLVLGGIALVVGGVGIMNTMIVTVMERRGEIGLRRALGARPGQVASQFASEAIVLSTLGGGLGVVLGGGAAAVLARLSAQPLVVPATTAATGLALSLLVGALAGLQPAIRASRVTPLVALRSV